MWGGHGWGPPPAPTFAVPALLLHPGLLLLLLAAAAAFLGLPWQGRAAVGDGDGDRDGDGNRDRYGAVPCHPPASHRVSVSPHPSPSPPLSPAASWVWAAGAARSPLQGGNRAGTPLWDLGGQPAAPQSPHQGQGCPGPPQLVTHGHRSRVARSPPRSPPRSRGRAAVQGAPPAWLGVARGFGGAPVGSFMPLWGRRILTGSLVLP